MTTNPTDNQTPQPVDIPSNVVGDYSKMKLNIQREAILRFYATITTQDYEYVVKQYLGQAQPDNWTNKLYMNVEAAVHFMNQDPTKRRTLNEQ